MAFQILLRRRLKHSLWSGTRRRDLFETEADYRTLGETLVNRGFIVVRDEEANPPFVRLVAGSAYGNKSPWLLHINNCRMPRELSKMVIRGAGKPN